MILHAIEIDLECLINGIFSSFLGMTANFIPN